MYWKALSFHVSAKGQVACLSAKLKQGTYQYILVNGGARVPQAAVPTDHLQ